MVQKLAGVVMLTGSVASVVNLDCASQTGLGKITGRDELVGVTRAFISAGTPKVLVSLSNVEDSGTAHLASFYETLKTMTNIEALRQAQLNLIHGNVASDLIPRRGIGGVGELGETPASKASAQDSAATLISTANPCFWAPFVLVGEGK
jgi:CHAT domain-containing protein